MASCVQISRAIGAFYRVWKWHNVQRARSEMRRCTTHALYRSKLWQQEHCQHPQSANPDGSTLEGTAQRIGRPFGQLRLWSLMWFQVRATSCHLTSSKSAEQCGDPLVQSGDQWQTLGVTAGLGAGPQVQKDPGMASEGVLRLCTLSHSPPSPPTWTRWTTSFGHTPRTSPTWPPTTPKPALSPPSAELPPALVEKACSQFRIRIEAVIEATLNRCQLYHIIKLSELIFSIKVLK